MKVVILSGGLGTRLSEETHTIPKPMVSIGSYPILWHIMKLYSHAGISNFVLALGYKSDVIKQYIYEFSIKTQDFLINTKTHHIQYLNHAFQEDWNISCIDTGLGTQTTGRIQRIKPYVIDDEDNFCITYGDGLSDVNIQEVIRFHKSHGKILTMALIKAKERFGIAKLDKDQIITSFQEKPDQNIWVNGGFFVVSKKIFEYLKDFDESMPFESVPLHQLAEDHQVAGYKHHGFWQCMDTLRDKILLNNLWDTNKAPWKLWK